MSDNTNIETFYHKQFIPRAHRIGQTTLLLALILCFFPALYLSFVLDAFPGIKPLLTGFTAIVGFVAVVWVVEPISYFPVLGVCGTYMSFLSGNIGNMRMPVVISCQSAIEAEPGSRRAEVAAVIGVAISVLVNLAFVLAVVLVGGTLIDMLPEFVIGALQKYTLPAIFGAVLVMFINNAKPRNIVIGLIVGVATFISPIPNPYNVAASGIFTIIVVFALNFGKKGEEKKSAE